MLSTTCRDPVTAIVLATSLIQPVEEDGVTTVSVGCLARVTATVLPTSLAKDGAMTPSASHCCRVVACIRGWYI